MNNSIYKIIIAIRENQSEPLNPRSNPIAKGKKSWAITLRHRPAIKRLWSKLIS